MPPEKFIEITLRKGNNLKLIGLREVEDPYIGVPPPETGPLPPHFAKKYVGIYATEHNPSTCIWHGGSVY
jgi:hypothetical protein